jgi:hypothetical protein
MPRRPGEAEPVKSHGERRLDRAAIRNKDPWPAKTLAIVRERNGRADGVARMPFADAAQDVMTPQSHEAGQGELGGDLNVKV